jgi:hypothetical protein
MRAKYNWDKYLGEITKIPYGAGLGRPLAIGRFLINPFRSTISACPRGCVMRACSLLLSVLLLAACCNAQQHSTRDDFVQPAMTEIQRAYETQDGRLYASTFGDNGGWEGPSGQFAAGRDNIQEAADLMFRTFGPLQPNGWVAESISADIVVARMYQKLGSGRRSSPRNVPTAPGSLTAPSGSDIRTVLILKRQNQRWEVTTAWVADIRLSKAQDPISATPGR